MTLDGPEPSRHPRAQALALLAVLVGLGLSWIDPPYPEDLWLHHAPTLALLAGLALWCRRGSPGDATLFALVGVAALHVLGARWDYLVPYDRWVDLSGTFGWRRNHYDRFMHLVASGLLVVPVMDLLARGPGVRGALAGALSVMVVLGIGALYEVFEWGLTLTAPADMALRYNGQQGDLWDAQKDLALAAVGASLVAGSLVLRDRRRAR